MSDYAPYYDDNGCLITPARPAIQYVPSRIERRPVVGWNAGANSLTQLNGDMHTVFSMPAGTVGAVIGFRGARTRQTVPDLIEHGLYFQSAGGYDMVQIVERGMPMTELVARAADDTFEIRRSAGRVTYWKGATLLHTSSTKSTGVKVVNACLYASGDAVGEATHDPVPTIVLFDYTSGVPLPDRTIETESPAVWEVPYTSAADGSAYTLVMLECTLDGGSQTLLITACTETDHEFCASENEYDTSAGAHLYSAAYFYSSSDESLKGGASGTLRVIITGIGAVVTGARLYQVEPV